MSFSLPTSVSIVSKFKYYLSNARTAVGQYLAPSISQQRLTALLTIPNLSPEERLDWEAWASLEKVRRVSPEEQNASIMLCIAEEGLMTSCGITTNIAVLQLLGAKEGVDFLFSEQELPISHFKAAIKTHKHSLYYFQIQEFTHKTADGHTIYYCGHVWSILKLDADRFLLLNSYLEQQQSTTTLFSGKELSQYIRDFCTISEGATWSKELSKAYYRCFKASHGEFSCLKKDFLPKNPWKITFKQAHVGSLSPKEIKKQFAAAKKGASFPKRHIFRPGLRLSMCSPRLQSHFDHGIAYALVSVTSDVFIKNTIVYSRSP